LNGFRYRLLWGVFRQFLRSVCGGSGACGWGIRFLAKQIFGSVYRSLHWRLGSDADRSRLRFCGRRGLVGLVVLCIE
jgi:hypothetical protein